MSESFHISDIKKERQDSCIEKLLLLPHVGRVCEIFLVWI